MLVNDLLTHIRDGWGQAATTRWTDAELLRVTQLAAVRAQGILQRNDVYFGRKKLDFNTVAGTGNYALPADFASAITLTRTDQHRILTHYSQSNWDAILSASEASCYVVDGDDILIAGVPTAVIPLRLRYWPVAPVISAGGSTPWQGKLDYILIGYIKASLYNTDEMNIGQDIELLQDLENNIVAQFAGEAPAVETHRGWMVV